MRTALTIAGSDSSGGAGIQADIKTMTMNGVYAMSAVTALTAQNTRGVRSVLPSTPAFLDDQLDTVFEDIFPDAVKIGMVPSPELAHVVSAALCSYGARNIVLDPVMVATSGSVLSEKSAIAVFEKELYPKVTLLTPNIPEAEILAGFPIADRRDMERAALAIGRKVPVLVKGGHSREDADDVLCIDGELEWFEGERIDNPNTHGTGCTLSSAIASGLARGFSLEDSIRRAKAYLSDALRSMLSLGSGSGPVNHIFSEAYKYME